MAKQWKDDQTFLLDAIPEYRLKIAGKPLKEARKITYRFAEHLHRNIPQVQHRSVESINQRLPYLDNLLAGVFDKENYAIKDGDLYATKPRDSGCREPNLCNTRHSYNGAIR